MRGNTGLRLLANGLKDFAEFITWLGKREIAYYQVKPREALFFLTYRCTSRCRMCKMWQRPFDYEEMDLVSWKRAVDIVSEQGVGVIYLFGGDVLLKRDILIPLAKYIVSKNICCDITTNGNLLNKEIASELIDTGVDNIGISIDALGANHDQIRMVKGMFERASEGIKELIAYRGKRCRPSLKVYCTVSSANINTFHEVIPYASELGIDQLHIEYLGEFDPKKVAASVVGGIKANPYYERQEKSLLLNVGQAKYLKEKVKELIKANSSSINLDTDNIDCLNVSELATGEFSHKRCYMARYHINVDPSGNIVPCLFFQHYYLGNIKRDNFQNIWRNEKHKIFLKALHKKDISICDNCIIGVQRNPTVTQAVSRKISEYAHKIKIRYV